jgi:hypothetical protein
MRLTDSQLLEVALLLIGLTKISLTKSRFNPFSVIETSLRLPPLAATALKAFFAQFPTARISQSGYS